MELRLAADRHSVVHAPYSYWRTHQRAEMAVCDITHAGPFNRMATRAVVMIGPSTQVLLHAHIGQPGTGGHGQACHAARWSGQ